MAMEILAVPEYHLAEVIAVLRKGLASVEVCDEVREQLSLWCNEEEEYINRVNRPDSEYNDPLANHED